MAVTPTSSAALAVDGARDLIAASASFTSWIQAYHGAGATIADHIYFNDVWDDGRPIDDLRPFCVISLAEHSYSALHLVSLPVLKVAGGVIVAFEDKPRSEDDNDAYLDFLNRVFDTLDDMSGAFGVDTAYPFTGIEQVLPPDRSDRNRRQSDDWLDAAYLLTHDREKAG